MPTAVTAYALGVWFCVGLFTGMGWAFGTWIVGVITAPRPWWPAGPPR